MEKPDKRKRIIIRHLCTKYEQTGESQVELILYYPGKEQFAYSMRERACKVEESLATIRRPLEAAGNYVEVIEQWAKEPEFNKRQAR